jgi:hypothetical protein
VVSPHRGEERGRRVWLGRVGVEMSGLCFLCFLSGHRKRDCTNAEVCMRCWQRGQASSEPFVGGRTAAPRACQDGSPQVAEERKAGKANRARFEAAFSAPFASTAPTLVTAPASTSPTTARRFKVTTHGGLAAAGR